MRRDLARPRHPDAIELGMRKHATKSVAQHAQPMRLTRDHRVQRQRKNKRLTRALIDHFLELSYNSIHELERIVVQLQDGDKIVCFDRIRYVEKLPGAS